MKPACHGERSQYPPPTGAFSAFNVSTPHHGTKVKSVNLNFLTLPEKELIDAKYELEIIGCAFGPDPPYPCLHTPGQIVKQKEFTGYFIDRNDNTGSTLIPVADAAHGGAPLSPDEWLTNKIFGHGIQWCPKEGWFVLNVPAIGIIDGAPYCKLPPVPKNMYATVSPYGDTSGPVQGSPCVPGVYGACGSGEIHSSGLSCKEEVFGAKVTYTCQP